MENFINKIRRQLDIWRYGYDTNPPVNSYEFQQASNPWTPKRVIEFGLQYSVIDHPFNKSNGATHKICDVRRIINPGEISHTNREFNQTSSTYVYLGCIDGIYYMKEIFYIDWKNLT